MPIWEYAETIERSPEDLARLQRERGEAHEVSLRERAHGLHHGLPRQLESRAALAIALHAPGGVDQEEQCGAAARRAGLGGEG